MANDITLTLLSPLNLRSGHGGTGAHPSYQSITAIIFYYKKRTLIVVYCIVLIRFFGVFVEIFHSTVMLSLINRTVNLVFLILKICVLSQVGL